MVLLEHPERSCPIKSSTASLWFGVQPSIASGDPVSRQIVGTLRALLILAPYRPTKNCWVMVSIGATTTNWKPCPACDQNLPGSSSPSIFRVYYYVWRGRAWFEARWLPLFELLNSRQTLNCLSATPRNKKCSSTVVKAIIYCKFWFLPGYQVDKNWRAVRSNGPACGGQLLKSVLLFLYCTDDISVALLGSSLFVWYMHCWADIHNFVSCRK